MFEFTLWDFIKMIILFPFIVIWNIVKSYNPINYTRDNKLINDLRDLMQEAEKFALYLNKGPTYLEDYKIKNSIGEHHIEFNFSSDKFNEQNRIAFFIDRTSNNFSLFIGGNSAGGSTSYSKQNPDYDKLAKEIYKTIELASICKIDKWIKHSDDWKNWKKENIDKIIKKYAPLENYFYVLRRALIMASHEKLESRYIKAKEELMNIFGNEGYIEDFTNEIEEAYSSKVIIEAISNA